MSTSPSPSKRQKCEWPRLVKVICSAFPETQAIYRFGSWGTVDERAESDLDIAVLLPWQQANQMDLWSWAALNGEIAATAHHDKVDLINLREVDVLLQFEVLRTGEIIFSRDTDAQLDFEVLTISKYQELHAWRKEFEQAAHSGELYSARP